MANCPFCTLSNNVHSGIRSEAGSNKLFKLHHCEQCRRSWRIVDGEPQQTDTHGNPLRQRP